MKLKGAGLKAGGLKLGYGFLRFGCLPAGLLLLALGTGLPAITWGMATPVSLFIVPLILLGGLMALLGLAVIQNVYFSHNRAWVNPDLDIETWPVTQDGMHNSNVDLIVWRDAFYLVHAVSRYHFGTQACQLVVKRSTDGRQWQPVARFCSQGEDIRDPKFALIHDHLYLYVLLNQEIEPRPYRTKVSWTADGINWADLENIPQAGWLFWRPKTLDGITWYAPAYWHQFGQTALFATSDGLNFEQVAMISREEAVNETEITFLPEGEMLAIARMEPDKSAFVQIFGSAKNCTLISMALPPYTSFSRHARDSITRLDGPLLFNAGADPYAVGRSEPASQRSLLQRGSIFKRKRTSLYTIHQDRLIYLSDFPSAGDTSYAGVAISNGFVYIAYYTGKINKDHRWLFSMLEPSEIRMVKFRVDKLTSVRDACLSVDAR